MGKLGKHNLKLHLATVMIRANQISLEDGDSTSGIFQFWEDRAMLGGDLKKSSSTSVQCTPDIEKKYVHRVYEAIAPHFSSTRFAKWPKVSTFLNALPRGSLVLDAGCGNGKYLGLNPECFDIGCDISPPLVNICLDRGNEVMVADAVNMPYRTDFGDAAISIAVRHHLSTKSRRIKAIEELLRVVRKGGLALITVWAVEQEDMTLLTKWTPLAEKYSSEWVGPGSPRVRSSPSPFALGRIPETDEKEYFVPWHLPYHRAEISGASVGALASGLAKRRALWYTTDTTMSSKRESLKG
ncbi:hypothetical protein MKW98_026113 [Papaver atlanticum]|uniref:Methyltransferase type 11 domain-containing protein n=1 Tax=Papaver atlanticum TaxID=357466 RepID=A0AAD4RY28_9MAGN|nr:hypothetical protein MKW98_026113 [Papaver atlanticum]